jgi:beta-N-acetylhexosaminidase
LSLVSKHLRLILAAGSLISLLWLILGCAATGTALQTNPAIRGSITSRNASNGQGGLVGSILVEGNLENDTQFDKASIAITSETQIFEQVEQQRQPATFEALQIGQTVEAWFTGPVAESYPVQAVASDIVILK